MTPVDLRRWASERGVELWSDGDNLRYRAPAGALTPEIRAGLAEHKAALMALLHAEQTQPGPLSHNQQSLWFVYQLCPVLPPYNVAVAFRIAGAVDRAALRNSLSALLRRHPTLRARYELDPGNGGRVRWWSAEDVGDPLDCQDVGAVSEAGLLALVRDSYAAPFDLSRGPVFRATLFSLSQTDHVLLLAAHHVSCDARSWHVILEDLGGLYAAAMEGREPSLATKPGSYRSFVAKQSETVDGPAGALVLAYWRSRLAGLRERPLLGGGGPRETAWSFRGGTRTLTVSAGTTAGLRALAATRGIPLFRVLLAAFEIALWKTSGYEDVVVGIPVSGRLRPADRDTVGYFVNPLPLRQSLDPTSTIAGHMDRTNAMVAEALEHQEYPFALLVEHLKVNRDPSRHPVFDVMFNYLNRQAAGLAVDLMCPRRDPEPLSLGPLRVFPYPLAQQEGQYDLTLEVVDNGQDLWCSFRYGEPSCGAAMARDVAAAWEAVLDRMVQDPATRISEVGQAAISAIAPERSTITIAGTFVADPVGPTVEFWLARLGFPADVRFAAYNQVFQQLVDRDSLFRRATSGLNVVLLKVDDWAADRTAPPDERQRAVHAAALDFVRWVRAFAPESRVPLVVVLCPALDAGEPWIREVEDGLHRELRGITGVEVQSHDDLLSAYAVDKIHEPAADAAAHVPYSEETYAALGTAIVRVLHRMQGKPTKVIVVDGDETLWGGVVGELGVAGLRIDAHHAALQQWLVERHAAGTLLCLCSKNEEKDVDQVFRHRTDMIVRREHFSVVVAGWRPKSEAIRDIARGLNLGLDSFLFVDDSPVECAEVAAHCPEVVTVRFPSRVEDATLLLRHLWSCDGGGKTDEDGRRALFYRDEATRDQLKKQSSSYREFIASLDLRIRISGALTAELPRIAQLTVRTTQFNLRSSRRTEQELERQLESPAHGLWSVHVADRFGDYGLVGAMVVSWGADVGDVDTFLLSCRALGRGVEHAMLSFLGEQARQRGVPAIELRCVTTDRNAPVRAFLSSAVGEYRIADPSGSAYRVPAEAARACAFDPDAAAHAPDPEPEVSDRAAVPPVSIVPHGVLGDIALSLNTARRVLDAVGRWTSTTRAPSAAVSATRDERAETDTERRIAEVWADVLKIESVPVDVSFFDLGGKSVLLPFVLVYLRERQRISVTLVDLFTYPTVRRLASFVDRQTGGEESTGLGAAEEQADRRAAARRRQGALRDAARRGGEATF